MTTALLTPGLAPTPVLALSALSAERRHATLRTSLDAAVDLPEPGDARKEAARMFAWARDAQVPMTEGLGLERPLLALALTGRRDPWPRLEPVPEAVSCRMRAHAEAALLETGEPTPAPRRPPAPPRRPAKAAAKKGRRR